MSYTHLTSTDRTRIATLKRARHTQREIAHQLGKHPATISRELWRNKSLGKRTRAIYNARTAKQKAAARRLAAHQSRRKLVPGSRVLGYVIRNLRRYWSPEQIAGRLAYETHQRSISYGAIYSYIKHHMDLHQVPPPAKTLPSSGYQTSSTDTAGDRQASD